MFNKYLKFLIILQCLLYTGYVQGQCAKKNKNMEKTLQRDLLCDYDKNMRPRQNSQEAINITIRLLVKTVSYSHEFSSFGVLNIVTWTVLIWKDEYLKWDPSAYNNTKETVMHSSTIWTPDLSLYNSPENPSASLFTYCLVTSVGLVTCIPHHIYRALCTSNYQKWPYDQQNCSLTFGTWMHKGEEISYFPAAKKSMDLSTMEPNKYWDVINSGSGRHDGVYACCPNNTYPTVTFWINIKRHSASTVIYFFTPAIIMITLTLSSIWLDMNSLERIILMLTNVYFHMMYLQELSTRVPTNGINVPNAVTYFQDTLILAGIVLVEGIALRAITKKKTVSPRWIGFITGFVNSSAGKIVIFNEFDPATSAIVAEDAENLSKEEMESAAGKEWIRFALVLNALFFIFVCITYVGLILRFLL